jgi:hypothetical protein
MDKSQNLPSIDEDALDGVAGGSTGAPGLAQLIQNRKAIAAAIATGPIRLAGAQATAIGSGLSAIGDLWTSVGEALSAVGKS